MKVKKRLRSIIVTIVCMVMAMSNLMVVQAAMQYSDATEYDGLPAEIKNNCVAFARYKVPSLPGGLYTKTDKKAIINSDTPAVGSIAITHGNKQDGSVDYDSYYGHVAYVEAVNGSQITTLNGGFANGHIERIVGTPAEQGVIGYWNPNGGVVTVSLNWSNISASPSNNNAAIHAEADTNVSGSFTEAGITVWNEAGQVVGKKTEPSGVTGTHINIDYDLANEVGAKLESGSNYTFQIYTVFNGKRYESSIGNFRTTGPSVNGWTQELSIENWTYGNEKSTPMATAKYGQVTYSYSTKQNGEYTPEVPQNAGTYFVKASVAATDQYTGLEAVKAFEIYKAVPSYEIPENVTAIYGQTLADVSLPEGFVWENDEEKVGDVGEKLFMASYVPEDTSNYEVIDKIEIAVTVNPKDMSGIDLSGIDKNTDLNKYEIKDGDTILVKDQDYKISTTKDGNKVTVTVEFMGNYTGTAETAYLLNDNTDKNAKNSKEDKAGVVKTGDTADLAMWLALVTLAGGTIVVALKKKSLTK